MTILDYVKVIINGWWIILALLLVSIGGALTFSFSQTPVYEASSTFLTTPTQVVSDSGDFVYSLDTLVSRSGIVVTYCNILTSKTLVDQAAINIGIPPEALIDTFEANCVVLPDSNVLQLTVTGPSQQTTADLANAIGSEGVTYIDNLQEVYELVPLDPALPQEDPVSPNHLIDLSLGIILGLLIGFGTVLGRFFLIDVLGAEQTSESASGGVNG